MKAQYIFLPMLFFASCSTELEIRDIIESDSAVEKIQVNLEDFKNEKDSRTNITTDVDGVHYVWAITDTLGIFPLEGRQVEFPMTEGAGSQSAMFSGGSWALKQSSTYAAYCPLIGRYYLDKTSIPVCYSGQEQDGNNTTSHLGEFDYLVAPFTHVKNGAVSFNFKRLGCVVKLEIPIQEPGNVTSVTLSCKQPIFIEEGTFDLSSTTPTISAEKPSKTFNIALKNLTTAIANETIGIYFMTPPIQMIGNEVTATVVNNGKSSRGTVQSKYMEVGTAYKLAVTMDGTNPIKNVIHVTKAGTLPKLIGDDKKFKLTELKVTGELNGTDIRFLREMAGVDSNSSETSGVLTNLDLSEAKIVKGGEPYFDNAKSRTTVNKETQNDVIGDYMFAYSKLTNILLPKTTKSIGNNAFNGNKQLGDIIIPDLVETIGSEAFANCISLANIAISQTVTEIGHSAFKACSSLVSIDIPKKVGTIKENTLALCNSLKEIVIPSGVKVIEKDAIAYCVQLTKIVIKPGLTHLTNSFFEGSPVSSIELPSTLQQIAANVIPENNSLKEIICTAETPPVVDSSNNIPSDCKISVPSESVDIYKQAEGWISHANNITSILDGSEDAGGTAPDFGWGN